MLTDIQSDPTEGNFCNEGGKAIKPQIVIIVLSSATPGRSQ